MIGVCEAVRICAQACDERTLLECENDLRRAGCGEESLDRVPALRVRRGMRVAVDRPASGCRPRRRHSHEGGPTVQRCPDLEVRRSRPAQRSRAEERAAQVGRPAARARDDTPRRTVEWKPVASHHSCLRQHGDRVLRAVDDELRARSALERVGTVGPDLRVDAEPAQDRERAPSDRRLGQVEVERRPRHGREGGRCRPCGRGPRAPRACRTGAREQRRRAPPWRRRRARPRSQHGAFEGEQAPLEPRARGAVVPSTNGSSRPAATILWQGTTSERSLRAQKLPAARAARGRPASAASPPYVTTSPHGDRSRRSEQLALERRSGRDRRP